MSCPTKLPLTDSLTVAAQKRHLAEPRAPLSTDKRAVLPEVVGANCEASTSHTPLDSTWPCDPIGEDEYVPFPVALSRESGPDGTAKIRWHPLAVGRLWELSTPVLSGVSTICTEFMSVMPEVSVKTAVKVTSLPFPPSVPPLADTELEVSCMAGAVHAPKISQFSNPFGLVAEVNIEYILVCGFINVIGTARVAVAPETVNDALAASTRHAPLDSVCP